MSALTTKFTDLPLAAQLLQGTLLLMLAIAGIAVVEYRETQTLEVTTVRVQQTLAIETLADDAATQSANMSDSYRAIVGGGSVEELRRYGAARGALLSDVGQVLSLRTADPTRQSAWQELTAHVAILDSLIDPSSGLADAPQGSARVSQEELAGNAPAIIDELNAVGSLVDRGREAEHQVLKASTTAASTSSQQARGALVAGTLALLAVGVLLSLLWSRQVATVMAAFASTAKDIAGGRLGRRLHLDRKDEIGQAARAFDSMANQMQALISERTKQAEVEARERGVLTAILNSMHELVYEVDCDGHLVRMNDAVLALTGQTLQSAVGRPAVEVLRWQDQTGRTLDADEYVFHQALLRGEPSAKRLYYAHGPNHKQIPYRCSSSLIRNRSGGISAIVEVARDISQETEANRLKDQIISLVSHELRTPVGNIKGFADSLLQPDVSWDEATVQDFISEIDKEADRLGALISDLLDMSRIEGGQAISRREPYSPSDLAARAIKARRHATAKHVVMNEVPPDLPAIAVDSSQVERVLGNLLENAAYYSPQGSHITLSAWQDSANLEWCVEDQGSGIADQDKDRIFEKFVRISDGRHQPPGTGLGLPICKGIVEAHGGRIWVESAAAVGSRFRFSLPITAGQGAVEAQTAVAC